MKLEKLYFKLKSLVAENIQITIRDNIDGKGKAEVVLQLGEDRYHWTHFREDTIENAIRATIKKLQHPNKDYIDDDTGYKWRAKESSCYSAQHIRTFLKLK